MKYPLRSTVPSWRLAQPDSDEVDQLESDQEDDLLPPPQPPPRPSPSKSSKHAKRAREQLEKDKNEKKRRKEEAKEEKRKRRKAEKKATAFAAKPNGTANDSSHPRTTKSPSVTPASGPSGTTQSQRPVPARTTQNAAAVGAHGDDDSDAPLPNLVVRSSASQRTHKPKSQSAPMSEDEVEFLATQPSNSQNASATPARSSSLPNLTDSGPNEQPTQRASSALPCVTSDSGYAENPILLVSSDAPSQPSLGTQLDDENAFSDVSSVAYSDSTMGEPGADFYTSSEGSLHGSDSEEGLGSWTKYDQENWQGSTAHLDDAYDDAFDIRAVIDHRKNPRRGFYEYRTVWAGYPQYSNSWEPNPTLTAKRR